MSFLIYNVDTLYIVDQGFKTGRGAKISWSRKHNKDPKLAVASAEKFHREIDYDIQVPSLMGGAMVTIKKSMEGTCCDPSTETYWSM